MTHEQTEENFDYERINRHFFGYNDDETNDLIDFTKRARDYYESIIKKGFDTRTTCSYINIIYIIIEDVIIRRYIALNSFNKVKKEVKSANLHTLIDDICDFLETHRPDDKSSANRIKRYLRLIVNATRYEPKTPKRRQKQQLTIDDLLIVALNDFIDQFKSSVAKLEEQYSTIDTYDEELLLEPDKQNFLREIKKHALPADLEYLILLKLGYIDLLGKIVPF